MNEIFSALPCDAIEQREES